MLSAGVTSISPVEALSFNLCSSGHRVQAYTVLLLH